MILLTPKNATPRNVLKTIVLLATEISRKLHDKNIHVRIGVHLGNVEEVVISADGLGNLKKNVVYISHDIIQAQRIMSFGGKDHILLSDYLQQKVEEQVKQKSRGFRILALPDLYWDKHAVGHKIALVYKTRGKQVFGNPLPPPNPRRILSLKNLNPIKTHIEEPQVKEFVSVTHLPPQTWKNDANLLLVLSCQAAEAIKRKIHRKMERTVIWPSQQLIDDEGVAVMLVMVNCGTSVRVLPQEIYDRKVKVDRQLLVLATAGVRSMVEFYYTDAKLGSDFGYYGVAPEKRKAEEDELKPIDTTNLKEWKQYYSMINEYASQPLEFVKIRRLRGDVNYLRQLFPGYKKVLKV
jgi:hypothetical protein